MLCRDVAGEKNQILPCRYGIKTKFSRTEVQLGETRVLLAGLYASLTCPKPCQEG